MSIHSSFLSFINTLHKTNNHLKTKKMKRLKSQFRISILFLLFTGTITFGQTKTQQKLITKQYRQQKLIELENQFEKKALSEKELAKQKAKEKGWETELNLPEGKYIELQKIASNGNPIYYTTYNISAARSTRADHLNTGGSLGLNLNGKNMTAHVWDAKVARKAHQEYDGPGGENRFSVGDNTKELHYHSAHVTGTIMASGFKPNAKGMAPQAKAIGYDWNKDKAEAIKAASKGMLISNHSYGYRIRGSLGQVLVPTYFFGGYIENSKDWDQIMYNAPYYLMVVAAGNDGRDDTANSKPLQGKRKYDKLTGHATAKNNIVVANADDARIDSYGNFVSTLIHVSSSEGPTDDLRIKPDITGNGTSVYSTSSSKNSAYSHLTGTSMASPNVAGSLLLLQEHYNNVNGTFMKAATLKGLALHTADDIRPPGPDAIHGWGLLNAKSAAETITYNGNKTLIHELSLNDGESYTITVEADGSVPLMASISWTDPAGKPSKIINDPTPALVNDLDIRITKEEKTFRPFKLISVKKSGRGDNTVDPFEKIKINNPLDTYTITVTHKGNLTNGAQNFSLIVTGITPDNLECTAETPTGITFSEIEDSQAKVSWNTVGGATYEIRYKAVGNSNWIQTSTSDISTILSDLSPNTKYKVQIKSICSDGTTSDFSTQKIFTTALVYTGCSDGIASYPYIENFENTLGLWTQDGDDDFDWSINTGGTPSNNTGPRGPGQGKYYLYMEASDPNYAQKRAILNSPCIDLSQKTEAQFSFKYHMWGAQAMGTLHFEISLDDGTTWTSLWNKSGNQGGRWKLATVDLSDYIGKSIRLRFNGITGNNWLSDIAIDAIKLTTDTKLGASFATLTLTFDDHPEETSWAIQKNTTNEIVASGGPYESWVAGSTANIDLWLSAGCYTIILYDEGRNGMCCSEGNGSYTLQNDVGGAILASGGSFGIRDTKSFCVGAPEYWWTSEETIVNEEITDTKIYPNPAKNTLSISTYNEYSSYRIFTILGQEVDKGTLKNRDIDVNHLSPGMYVLRLTTTNKQQITKQFIKE